MATTIHLWPMSGIVTSSGSTNAFSASTTAMSAVFVARKTGTIDRIQIRCTAVTGTAPTFDFRIETVSAGVPSGTLWATNTNASLTPTANTTHTVTLTAAASVTAGQVYAVTVKYLSGTINASNQATFTAQHSAYSLWSGGIGLPSHGVSSNSGSTYTRTSGVTTIAPLYSDGEAERFQVATFTSTSSNLNTGGVTDIGCRFTAPMTCSLVGALVLPTIAATNLPVLTLFDLSSNSLATQTLIQTPAGPNAFYFQTPAAIIDGTDYRLVLASGSATNLNITRYQFTSAATRSAAVGEIYYTSRTSGTWTDLTDFSSPVIPLFASPTSSGGSSIAFNPVVRLPC